LAGARGARWARSVIVNGPARADELSCDGLSSSLFLLVLLHTRCDFLPVPCHITPHCTAVIGKEKILFAVRRATGRRVYVDDRKWGVLARLGFGDQVMQVRMGACD
jgi:hypothetical protein